MEALAPAPLPPLRMKASLRGVAFGALALFVAAIPRAAAAPDFLYKPAPDIAWDAAGKMPARSLSALGMERRKLVLFAPSAGDPALRRQLALIGPARMREEMRARDLVVVAVLQKGSLDGALADVSMTGENAAAAARTYGIAPDAFAAFLVGRTGTVKAVAGQPMEPAFLFELIDSLPMRRREMRAAAAARR